MERANQKELLSLAYVRAVAAVAGYAVTAGPYPDDDSVDGILTGDFGRRPRIDFQAKATARDVLRGSSLHFPLPIKNYDDLRVETITPRILVVLLMPEEPDDWTQQTSEELCLRHCAYWTCLTGEPASSNANSVTVEVPTARVFSSSQLADLMSKAERGDALC